MGHISDQDYLLSQQYRNGTRFTARGLLHARFRTNTYGWFPWLFDHLQLPPQSRILELGCGLGWLWAQPQNMTRIPAGWDITLSDFSQGMLAETQQRLHASPHPFDFAVIDAQAIPYADNSFDGVIANHMLYHVPDRAKAFAEIRRILKPGGRFYASTLGEKHLRELWPLLSNSEYNMGRSFSFNLENGADQLAAFFHHIELYRYDDVLAVTDAEPLLAYLSSLSAGRLIPDENARARLINHVEAEIAAHGAFQLTTDSGLFEAW